MEQSITENENGMTATAFVLLFLFGQTSSASVCLSGAQTLMASPSNSSEFTSPGYPDIYPNNVTCIWTITAPSGYFVKLDFSIFKLQYRYKQASCESEDHVEVRNGKSSSADLIDRYCATDKTGYHNQGVYSSGRYMFVRFKSDTFNSSRAIWNAFRATYRAIKHVKSCSVENTVDQNRNIILTTSSGILEGPSEQDWKDQISFHGCTWNIELPANRSIVNFTFTHFEKNPFRSRSSCLQVHIPRDCLSQPGRCSHRVCEFYDYLDIYDGFANTGIFLGRYCREVHPPQRIFTSGRRIAIVFRRYTLGHIKRFSATFSSLAQNAVSGVCESSKAQNKILVTGSAGVISKFISPAMYPGNVDCTWTITAPTGKHIKLTFLSIFKLGSSCEQRGDLRNYVQIRDGALTTSPSLGKFCGTLTPSPVETSGPSAVVQLKSRSFWSRGFFAMYEVTDKAPIRAEGPCSPYNRSARSFTVSTSSGIITSPNYPNMVPVDIECVWKIAVPDGKRVKFVINTIDLWCDNAFLELRDGPGSSSKTLGRYCGVSQPKDIYTTSRYLWISFRSGYKMCVNSRGFQAFFVAVDKEPPSNVGLIVGVTLGAIISMIIILLYVYKRKRST